MSIAINLIHEDIRATLKKHNSAFVAPEDIDKAVLKAAIDILKDIIDQYEAGEVRYMADQELLILHSFTGDATERTLPEAVFKVASVFIGDYEGDILPHSEFNDRANSVVIPPSATRPVGTVYNNGTNKLIRILPTSTSHKIKYWANPAVVDWNDITIEHNQSTLSTRFSYKGESVEFSEKEMHEFHTQDLTEETIKARILDPLNKIVAAKGVK